MAYDKQVISATKAWVRAAGLQEGLDRWHYFDNENGEAGVP